MSRRKQRAWSNVKDIIPSAPAEEMSPRVAAILAAKDERQALDMLAISQEFAALDEEIEFEERAQSQRNIIIEALKRRALEELQKIEQLAGTDMWRGNGQTFSPKNNINVTVSNQKDLYAWIKETKQVDLLTINSSRLKSIIVQAYDKTIAENMTPAQRAALKPGDPGSMQPPPGVSITLYTTVHRTAARTRSADTDDAPAGPEEGPF